MSLSAKMKMRNWQTENNSGWPEIRFMNYQLIFFLKVKINKQEKKIKERQNLKDAYFNNFICKTRGTVICDKKATTEL